MDQLYVALEDNPQKNNLSNLIVNIIKKHKEYNFDTQLLQLNNENELASNDQLTLVDSSKNFSLNNNSPFFVVNKLDDQIQYPSAMSFGTFFHDVISKVYDDFSYGYQYLNQKMLNPSVEKSFILKTRKYLEKIQFNKDLSFISDLNPDNI